MTRVILLGIFFSFVAICDGTRCFECNNVQFPRDCTHLTVCSHDECCFTEQVVTTSGNILFNSGCLPKSSCPSFSTPSDNRTTTIATPLVSRTTTAVKRRIGDIKTCIECCSDDFCNMKGCGAHEIPIEQRGPYCYTCDVLDPKACTAVAVCAKDEVCMLHSPIEFSRLPGTIHRGLCETQALCDALPHAHINKKCVPRCCDTDFCNDACGSLPTASSTTSHQYTAINSTTTPAQSTVTSYNLTTQAYNTPTNEGSYNASSSNTTPHISSTHQTAPLSTTSSHTLQCEHHEGFILLRNAHAQLCVHTYVHHDPLSWADARTRCKRQGGDLVVLDTHQKALLLRKELESHHRYHHSFYWIGAKDFKSSNHFSWVNGHILQDSKADWTGDQPDHFKHGEDQDCVCMYRDGDPAYGWHDRNCDIKGNFICELK